MMKSKQQIYSVNKQMKSQFILRSVLFLAITGTAPFAFADGCVPVNSTKHVRMNAYAGVIKLKGKVEKYQEIGRFTFQKDAVGVDHIATCSPGATIYAVAGQGQPAEPKAKYLTDIDGKPAFALPRSRNSNLGTEEYAYVLIDNATDRPYGNMSNYSELSVGDDKMRERPATVILYAAVDNPSISMSLDNIVLGGLRPNLSGEYQTGYTYMFNSGSITAGATSCSLNNPHNLSIKLPSAPVSVFKNIGATYAKESTELEISCTGEMEGKITLQLDSNQSERDDSGKYSVIKNENEGGRDAEGIGFVLSSNGKRLIDENEVRLPSLGTGTTRIPLTAEYYRYGNSVSAGRVHASVSFVVEFN